MSDLEKERTRLHQDLQQCLFEIHRRDQYIQQVAHKLQQVEQEKTSLSSQLSSVSQALREAQEHSQQGAVYTEVAPGAPQERSSEFVETEAASLRDRLQELEQSLSEERERREAAEEALRTSQDTHKLMLQSREALRDFSIDMETEEEWDAVSLDPNQPLITRKVRGSVLLCRQWLHGRSLYFSRLLRSRSRARLFFVGYLLALHVLLLMCLSGGL